jgi:hypothetical protein
MLYLSLIQLSEFRNNWNRLKLTDDDLRRLEAEILIDPESPPVMRGTGGLRKMRFAPPSSGGGKSGGIRVCYAYFPEFGFDLSVRGISEKCEGKSYAS